MGPLADGEGVDFIHVYNFDHLRTRYVATASSWSPPRIPLNSGAHRRTSHRSGTPARFHRRASSEALPTDIDLFGPAVLTLPDYWLEIPTHGLHPDALLPTDRALSAIADTAHR